MGVNKCPIGSSFGQILFKVVFCWYRSQTRNYYYRTAYFFCESGSAVNSPIFLISSTSCLTNNPKPKAIQLDIIEYKEGQLEKLEPENISHESTATLSVRLFFGKALLSAKY